MTQDMRVAMTTSLNDRLVAPLRRSLDEVEKNLKRLQKELQDTSRTSAQTSRTLGDMQGPVRAAKQAADLARNTNQAVTLAERLERAWNRTGAILKGVGSTMAAWQAAKYVLSGPMQQERTYGRQLADLANTAFADRDVGGRLSGMQSLDDIIQRSLRAGGGKREGAVEALSTLMAMGGFTDRQLDQVMPEVMRVSTAANANPKEIAELVGKALKNGFEAADIPTMLGKAIASGQAGGFEMKDMAKWLPKLLAAGSTIGMRGMRDFEEILALSQVAVTSAGGSDEAGNNLLNFLLKVNSSDTQNDAKKQGIDLSGTLVKNRGEGMSAASAFLALLQQSADKDPRMVKLRAQYAAAGTDAERLATLESQRAILSGTALGKFLQDRQALMPAVAALNNPKEMQRQLEAVRAGGARTTDLNFQTVAATNDFKAQQMENEQLFAQTKVLATANSALSTYSERVTALYQKYPGFGEMIEAAKLAVTTLAAAAGAAAGALFLLAGGRAAGAAAGAAGGAAAGAAAARAAAGAVPITSMATLTQSMMAAPAAAAGGGVAAAGAAALPVAVLGAGMLMSDRLESVKGLTDRIDTRNARLAELQELSRLDGKPGKYQAEIEALTADREAMRNRYGAQVGGGRGMVNPTAAQPAPQVNVKVYLDGREMNAHVEEETAYQARRK